MRAILRTAALLAALAAPGLAQAQQRLRVIDIAPNDVLNMRELPTTQSRIVGLIPPDGRGLVATGEVEGDWVFVRHGNVEGWVSRRFVAPEAPPIRRGRVLDPGGGKS